MRRAHAVCVLLLLTPACGDDAGSSDTDDASDTEGSDAAGETPGTSATSPGTSADTEPGDTQTGPDSDSSSGEGPGGPSCGDGVLDPGEECDGVELDGATCAGMGFNAGEVMCTADCTLDTSACALVCEELRFTSEPVVWEIPGDNYPADGDFWTLAGSGSCQDGEVDWVTTDLDGDGRLDLIITDGPNCDSEAIGETRWLVHRGGDSGFADDPAVWNIPGANYPADGDFWAFAGSGSCQDGEVDWVTTDLDGDGRLDLVITDGPNCDGEAIGETRWLAHFGQDDGFAEDPAVWNIPGANYPADGDFWTLAGSGSCQDGEVDWVTIDLDGDGRLDLVITDGPNCDGEAIGENRWLVHFGQDGGFADDPAVWNIPGANYPADGDFWALAGSGSCQDGEVDWVTIDLDGDGRLDLVITDGPNCDGEAIGETRWLVHRGQDGGFAEDPVVWNLPGANYPADGDFWSLAGSGSCQDGEVDWVTTDLDGDGRLDLVITDGPNCDGEAIGETRWLVHLGGDDGFAEDPAVWEIPGANYPTDGDFWTLAGSGSCQDGEVDWVTTDLDGDGRLDLVITDGPNCDGEAIGETRWLLHTGCL